VSYGIYNNVTDTISSADLDITILDQFVKRIGVDLESKPGNRLSYVFVVEAPSGKLLVRIFLILFGIFRHFVSNCLSQPTCCDESGNI